MTLQATKTSGEPVRVFLLVENRLVRETLLRLFNKLPELLIVGHGSSIEESNVVNCPCDIVIVDDLHTASLLGCRFMNSPPGACPKGIVLIGMGDDEALFVEAIRAGVSAYLLSDASASDVVAAVRATARGEAVCPPRLCLSLFRLVAGVTPEARAPVRQRTARSLTMRQLQLLSLVAKGLTNKEIASQLNLSEFTVKNHMYRIMKAVEAENRRAAVEAVRALGYAPMA